MPEERSVCPIRFIRKPEESECVREMCAFWVGGEHFEDEVKGPARFTAIMTMQKGQEAADHGRERSAGKCALLAIAEVMVKNKP
jgi:hypothetical protein